MMENDGRLIEHEFATRLLSKHYSIYDENDLRKLFGYPSVGVDFLVDFGTHFIAMQIKYRRSRRREDEGIKKFIDSVEYIQNKSKKTFYGGLWISRILPFDDNMHKLKKHNIECVAYFDCMQTLIDLSLLKIDEIIHALYTEL